MGTENTRDRIMHAAHELFYQYGIRRITMDDIARHLSISKKTIYQYFEEKNEIVNACCKCDLTDSQCEMESILKNSKDAVHEIIECMKYLSNLFSGMNPNLFYDMQKFHPEAWSVFRNFKENKILKMVEENLQRGIKEGLYRPDLNIKVLAKLRIEQVELAMNPTLFPPSKFNLKDVQIILLDHFIYGITTVKGQKLIEKYKN